MPSVNGLLGRARRFIDNSALSAAARSVRHERLTYLSPRKLRRLETALREVLRRGVPGDVLEFGMALGGSAIVLAGHARGHGRGFHGFDVFAMIPPPTSEKDDEKSRERYQTIADGRSKGLGGDVYYGYRDDLYGDVCRSFSRHGLEVDGATVRLHRGLFEHTLPKAGIERVAFAHIDCDWYDPVAYCLNSIAECIEPHGAIVLDDYHDYGGCRAATDEFVRAHPDFDFEDGDNVILRRAAINA
jgi:asparagine synthase (glutamine-hydrolysing)